MMWKKLKICMEPTHHGQVVSCNRSICLIVGDVVCLCSVTATVLEIKAINYEQRKVFVMVAARGVALNIKRCTFSISKRLRNY